MSEQKLTCGVCHAYLFDDDDVVYCPVCGAPHHRECYNGVGHCAFEEAHGTKNQYKKPESGEPSERDDTADKKTITCAICGESYAEGQSKCPKCGAPNFGASAGAPFIRIDFLGGVPEDTDLGEGVTAGEARRFVFSNTSRYIPKFAAMKNGKKTGWNWFAFLFPCGWFLSRKMYLAGVISGILSVCFSLFMIPFITQNQISTFAEYSNYLQTVTADPAKGGTVFFLFLAGGILRLILNVVCAVFGDRIYRDHAIGAIRQIKSESDDIDMDYQKKGGTNLLLFIVGFLAVQYAPQMLFAGFFM